MQRTSELGGWLFRRYGGNPILAPCIWPYPVNAVMHPGAIRVNNETVLLVRVEDAQGTSHLTVARSRDGFANWLIDTEPTMCGNVSDRSEARGIEDARIVWLEEQKQFAITYISYGRDGRAVSLAITRNFKTFARLGSMLPPDDGDACLFPRRFNGRFALLHRPLVQGQDHIWMSLSPDLKHWGDHRPLIRTRPEHWDCHRVGLACQPIECSQGWLLFYHGVQEKRDGPIYRVGIALLGRDEPWRVLRRSTDWIMEPKEPYECDGDIGGMVFPTGAIVNVLTNEINLYYGTAQGSVAVATAELQSVEDYIESCPRVG